MNNKIRLFLTALVSAFFLNTAIAQTIPAGFTEKYSRLTPGTGTANNFFPGLQIRAYIADKKDAGGSQHVIWTLKTDEHYYKEVKFTKFITTVCGNKLVYPVTFLGLKPGEVRYWKTTFGLDEYIGEKECKTSSLPVASISIDNITCKLDHQDPFLQQEKSRLEKIELDKKVNEDNARLARKKANSQFGSTSNSSTTGTRAPQSQPSLGTPSATSSGTSSSGLGNSSLNQQTTISTIENNSQSLNTNSQVKQELVNLVDKYLVDKEKLKDNAAASAAIDFARKAQLATNKSEIAANTFAYGLFGLTALLTETQKSVTVISSEEAASKESIANEKLNASKPAYIGLLRRHLLRVLEEIKNADSTVKISELLCKLNVIQNQLIYVKGIHMMVSIYSGSANHIHLDVVKQDYNYYNSIYYSDKWMDENSSPSFIARRNYERGKGYDKNTFLRNSVTSIKPEPDYNSLKDYTLQFPVPSSALGKFEKLENPDSYFGLAYNKLEYDYDTKKAFPYLHNLDLAVLDTNNFSLLYEAKHTQMEGDSWQKMYSAGAFGLKKVLGMTFLADFAIDSALASNDVEKLKSGINKYASIYHWFKTSIQSPKSQLLNTRDQYAILQNLFNNYTKAYIILSKKAVPESQKKELGVELLKNILNYIDYSRKYLDSPEIYTSR